LDMTPATITLTMPSVDNQIISGTYSLSEDVSSAIISFMGNGQTVGTRLTNLVCGTHTTELSGASLGLTDGSYTVTLTVCDLAGNISSTSTISAGTGAPSWQYDTIMPVITLNKPFTGGIDNQSIGIDYTVSEVLSDVKVVFVLGTQAYTVNCGLGTTTIDGSALLTHGATYTVQIIGTDIAGNAVTSNMSSNWQYDNQIDTPTLQLGSGTVTASAVVNTTIGSAADTVGWLLSESQTVSPAESSSSWLETKPTAFQLSVGNGTKTVSLWCKDRAGNISQPAVTSIKLDTTLDDVPPTISLILPATGGRDNESIRLSYYLSEPCKDARLTFGTDTMSTGSLSMEYGTHTVFIDGQGLINGQTYTVTLSMSDMNNNRATSTSTNWTYDTTIDVPSFYLMNKITGSRVYTHSPRVDVSVREHSEAAGWLISETPGMPTEEAVINTRPSEFTLSSGDGTKTVYLWCKDMAGNISQPATNSIILKSDMDTTPPVVNLISPADNGVDNESIQLCYTISEDAAAMSLTFVRTGGSIDVSHSYNISPEYLMAGQHCLVVSGNVIGLKSGAIYNVSLKAIDVYENSGQDASANWQYDTTIATPTITLNQGSAYTNVLRVVVAVSNDAEASSWLIGTTSGSPVDNDPRWLTDRPAVFELGDVQGTRSVYLWTRDALGNISATATASIVLDMTPATITLTMPSVDNQ
ncbi:MAG: hypothetical protein QME49_09580, partial [bacterium]|nr:hypothetical protein [bacterium]